MWQSDAINFDPNFDFSRLYGELIDKIHSDFPESILYVQSIFPVTGWYAEKDNGIDNEKVVAYNKLLLDLANEKGCYYLDVHSALVNENGVLPDDMSPDGIHLNAPHYQKWFHYLKTHTVQ
jgi:lysophospholipase L1-like esterase